MGIVTMNNIPTWLYDFHHKPNKKFFPYKVELYNTNNYEYQKEMYLWCNKYFGKRSCINNSRWWISATGYGELFFWSKNIEDTVAFKLRWM